VERNRQNLQRARVQTSLLSRSAFDMSKFPNTDLYPTSVCRIIFQLLKLYWTEIALHGEDKETKPRPINRVPNLN
jgi:hypothetical protein